MKILRTPQEIELKKLPEGMSQKAFEQHYDVLYKGYVNKYNEIQERLRNADLATGNPTYSVIRELKREELFAANAIRLHEAYFRSLDGDGRCDGTVMDWIAEDFNSYEHWMNEWFACGMSARGWVVLAYDMADGRLHNYTLDIHSDGILNAIPLLVMDVYEHAYYMDWGTGRKSYLESYIQSVNWEYVNKLVDHLELNKVRAA